MAGELRILGIRKGERGGSFILTKQDVERCFIEKIT